MNIIIACVMAAIALAVMLYFIIGKPGFMIPATRKFIIAASAVYLSGTVFLLIMTFIKKELPLVFIIIAEVSILSVFLVSLFSILRITKNIKAIMQDVEDGKIKGEVSDEDKDEEDKDN